MTQPSEAEVTTSAALGAFFPHPHGNEPIRAELFGAEHLEAHARQLAACAAVAPVVAGQPLLSRFRRNSRALLAAHRFISEAYRRGESFGSPPERLFADLPIISDRPGQGRPGLPGASYKLLPQRPVRPLSRPPRDS